MNRFSAKFDATVLAIVNGFAWLVKFDAELRALLTVLSIFFLLHRWGWWWFNRNKRQPDEQGDSNS